MADRKPIVGGNWKMNTDLAGGTSLAREVVAACGPLSGGCDVVLCPPFPYLGAVGEVIGSSGLMLGAQDVYHETSGAFTGEVSPDMLLDVGARWVLCGHSERRHVIGEDGPLINRKIHAALAAGLSVIVCVGETLEEREAGRTEAVNDRQLVEALEGVEAASMDRIVIAYEPVWAIGTGRTATPEDAQTVHGLIRARLADLYDEFVADSIRIQYGGSVKANNARELFAQPDIDGGLIGGASLDSGAFEAIVRAAADG